MRNDPRCARASSRPLALTAAPGDAALGDAFTRRASAAEEDLDEDADDVAGDEDRAHVPASRGSAPALRAKKRRRVALRGEEKIEHLPLDGHVAGSAFELREEPRAVQDRHRVGQQQPAARGGDDGTRCFFPGGRRAHMILSICHSDSMATTAPAAAARGARCASDATLCRRFCGAGDASVHRRWRRRRRCVRCARDDGGGAAAQGDVESGVPLKLPQLKNRGLRRRAGAALTLFRRHRRRPHRRRGCVAPAIDAPADRVVRRFARQGRRFLSRRAAPTRRWTPSTSSSAATR